MKTASTMFASSCSWFLLEMVGKDLRTILHSYFVWRANPSFVEFQNENSVTVTLGNFTLFERKLDASLDRAPSKLDRTEAWSARLRSRDPGVEGMGWFARRALAAIHQQLALNGRNRLTGKTDSESRRNIQQKVVYIQH